MPGRELVWWFPALLLWAGDKRQVKQQEASVKKDASCKAFLMFPSTYLVPDKILCRCYLPDLIWNWSFKDSGCVAVYDCPFICSFTCQLLLLWCFLPLFQPLLQCGRFFCTLFLKLLFRRRWWLYLPDTFSYFWYSNCSFKDFFF